MNISMKKTEKLLNNSYVTKCNQMIEAHYSLKAIHQKIILILTSLYNPKDKDFKEAVFKVTELMSILGIGSENHTYMKQITKQLQGCTIDLIEDNGEIHTQTNWMEYSRYISSSGIIKLKLHPLMKPYVLQLSGHFTRYKLSSVINLSSSYSIRIYELLMQYIKIGKRNFDLDDLKKKVGVPDGSFKRYPDFRRYVLVKAQNELELKSDICFDFVAIKAGKQVNKIEFTIYKNIKKINEISKKTGLNIKQIKLKNDANKKTIDEISHVHGKEFTDLILKNLSSNNETDLSDVLISEFYFKNEDTQKLIKDFGKERIWEKYHYYHYKKTKQEIKNPKAWFINAVVKDYNTMDMGDVEATQIKSEAQEKIDKLKANLHDLKIQRSCALSDIDSPISKYDTSIRLKYEKELADIEIKLKATSLKYKSLMASQ